MRGVIMAAVLLAAVPAMAQEDPFNPGFHEMAQAVLRLPPEQRKVAAKGLTLAMQATMLARSEAVLAQCREDDARSAATPNQSVRAQDLDAQRRVACRRMADIAAKQRATMNEAASLP